MCLDFLFCFVLLFSFCFVVYFLLVGWLVDFGGDFLGFFGGLFWLNAKIQGFSSVRFFSLNCLL